MGFRRPRVVGCGLVAALLGAVLGPIAIAGGSEPDRAARDQFEALVATIDRLVAAGWEESGVTPAAPADDAEFLRRIALDLTGKIPTAGEAREFLDDPRPDKRARLVDRLLASPAHVAHVATLDRRLMIPEAETGILQRLILPSFDAWLRQQGSERTGYDRMVREILTVPISAGQGNVVNNSLVRAREPSPFGFLIAKEAKSENLAASTARVFLGLRLECAQCHNHPFATWTRDQFWGYAAFFAGLEPQSRAQAVPTTVREVLNRRELTIPGTSRIVQARYLDGQVPQWGERERARDTLAGWMTAPENPYFSRAAANRLWAQFFGVGVVEPIDDMGEANPPSHPELLDALAHAFAHHGFDRDYLSRAIVASRAYQLSSAGSSPGSSSSLRLFERMAVRGLSAEQLYDSVAQAVGLAYEERRPNVPIQLANPARAEFVDRFARGDEKPTETSMSILQALALMNGRLVASATRLDEGTTLGAVADAPYLDTPGRIEALMLATLSRRPSSRELERLAAYVDQREPRQALSDVFWALLNSPEFAFNH